MPIDALMDSLPDLAVLVRRDGTILGHGGGHGLSALALNGESIGKRLDNVWPEATAELVTALAGFKRQALHAARLKLEHPVTGREVEWEAPLPADMTRLVEVMEGDSKAANLLRR